MKEQLIKTNFNSRKKIDQAAKILGISNIGSRSSIEKEIRTFSYNRLKTVAEIINNPN